MAVQAIIGRDEEIGPTREDAGDMQCVKLMNTPGQSYFSPDHHLGSRHDVIGGQATPLSNRLHVFQVRVFRVFQIQHR